MNPQKIAMTTSSQTQADFIALADAIPEHCDPDYRLTYVDMVVEGDVDAIYTNIAASRIGVC